MLLRRTPFGCEVLLRPDWMWADAFDAAARCWRRACVDLGACMGSAGAQLLPRARQCLCSRSSALTGSKAGMNPLARVRTCKHACMHACRCTCRCHTCMAGGAPARKPL